MVVVNIDGVYAVLAAEFDRRSLSLHLSDPLYKETFKMRLLKVDEGGIAMAFFGEQVELVNPPVVMEHFTKIPDDALVQHRPPAAVAVGDLQRAFCKTDRAAALPHALMIVQKNDRNALEPQVQRSRNANRAAAHHDDRMTNRRRGVLIAAAFVRIEPEGQLIAVIQRQDQTPP